MLTREQIQGNINALEKQGAKPQEIQQWLDSLATQKPVAQQTPAETKPQSMVAQQTPAETKPQSMMDKILSNPIVKGIGKFGGALQKAGEMFLNPTINALQTGLAQPVRKLQEQFPGGATGREVYQTPFGENKNIKDLSLGEKATQLLDVTSAVLPVEQLVKKPLTLAAEKLYQSALKARDIVKGGKVITKAADIAKIGLNERVWLTSGGVEKVANKIDNFEVMLGEAIDKAKSKGGIAVNEVVKYVDEAKEFFANQANRVEAKSSIEYLDNLKSAFKKDFGAFMPIQKAQQVKVATGQALKKYYNQMSSVAIEGEKQLVRGLKEKIVEKAPVVGDINARLSNLYKFDTALQKASTRIKNLNLLGLGTKIGAAAVGSKGALIGALTDLADKAFLKSGAAISLDRLAHGGQTLIKGAKVPVASLIDYIRQELENK